MKTSNIHDSKHYETKARIRIPFTPSGQETIHPAYSIAPGACTVPWAMQSNTVQLISHVIQQPTARMIRLPSYSKLATTHCCSWMTAPDKHWKTKIISRPQPTYF